MKNIHCCGLTSGPFEIIVQPFDGRHLEPNDSISGYLSKPYTIINGNVRYGIHTKTVCRFICGNVSAVNEFRITGNIFKFAVNL